MHSGAHEFHRRIRIHAFLPACTDTVQYLNFKISLFHKPPGASLEILSFQKYNSKRRMSQRICMYPQPKVQPQTLHRIIFPAPALIVSLDQGRSHSIDK